MNDHQSPVNRPESASFNPPVNNPYPAAPGAPLPPYFGYSQPPAPKKVWVYDIVAYSLLPLAFGIGLLLDLLLHTQWSLFIASNLFWLVCLVAISAVNWKRLKTNKILWVVAAQTTLLCIWPLLFKGSLAFGIHTQWVIPSMLMFFAQSAVSDLSLKQTGAMTAAWLSGWFVKPFSAIGHFFGATASLLKGDKRAIVKKVLLGLLLTLPILLIVLPLLASADAVFGDMLGGLFRNLSLSSLFTHFLITAVATLFAYSYFWNLRFGTALRQPENARQPLDTTVCCIVMSITSIVYLLFCLVQFTYLFARAGLPADLTYSEYAREGFWQLLIITGLNLLLFGFPLRYAKPSKALKVCLSILVGMTCVLLLSAFVRLNLLIGVYGLTWARLFGGWFMIFLAAVQILCVVRMCIPAFPLISVCGLLLLTWFVILGYSNPDAIIVSANDARGIHTVLGNDGFFSLARLFT